MGAASERLALADPMQLHNERVAIAIETSRRLRAELEDAERRQAQVMQSRAAFVKAI